MIVTVTQLGYAAGLVLIAPLGDLFENRRLIATVLCGTVVALAAAALAPSFGAFIAASLGIAAHLAPAKRRGRVVGQVMSGLLTGILLARAAAGGSRARSAGALFAPLAGRLGDSGHERIVTGGAFLAAAAAFALTLLQKQMWALVCGAIVLDLAVQTTLVLGQRAIGSTCWGRTPVGDRRALRRFLAGTVFFRDSPYRFCCAT